jgi:hypothetical protein
MMTGKNQSSQQMTALGSMLQASTYGMTIPDICGTTISNLLAIWAANFRQGGSTKKFKQLKKGITAYTENIDFLIGYNPILGVLQFWVNNGKYPLNFVTQTFSGSGPWTITDANFYSVIGVSTTVAYNENFNDYGGTAQTVSGNFEVPLWNELVMGPDPTGSSQYRNWPYAYRWESSYGATIQCDAPGGFTGPVTVYYAQLSSATLPDTPVSKLRMHFEPRLGDGDEFDGDVQGTSTPLSDQQVIYDAYAGCGSASIDLGSSGAIPSITPEVQAKYALYPSGDCDFVDIIEHVLKSGIMQSAIGATAGYGPIQTGVSLSDYPGAIQMKSESGQSSEVSTIVYDMPVTEGNFLVVIANGGSGLAPAYNNAGGALAYTISRSLGNNVAGAVWEDFSLATYYPLPSDAVIQGIYPVVVAVNQQEVAIPYVVSGTGLSLTTITGAGLNNPFDAHSHSGGFGTTVFWGSSIGTALSALTGQEIAIYLNTSLNVPTPPNPGPFLIDALDANAVGYAIYYTSATPIIDPQMPAPFAIPAGQGVAWALPSTAFSSGAFGSGGFGFFDPSTGSGAASAASAISGPLPAPYPDGLTDTAGNTWTPVLGSGLGTQVWYATANATGPDTVNISGSSFTAGVTVMEIAGTDTFDSATVGSAGNVTQVATGAPGLPAYMLAIPLWDNGPSFPEDPAITNWENLTPPNYYGNTPAANHLIFERRVSNPGAYSFSVPGALKRFVPWASRTCSRRRIQSPYWTSSTKPQQI